MLPSSTHLLQIVNLTLLGLLGGQCIYVSIFYGRHYHRKHGPFTWRGLSNLGLIPLHVLIISTLFLAFAGEAALLDYYHFSLPRALVNTVLLLLSNYALWLILSFERRRFHRASPAPARRDETT